MLENALQRDHENNSDWKQADRLCEESENLEAEVALHRERLWEALVNSLPNCRPSPFLSLAVL